MTTSPVKDVNSEVSKIISNAIGIIAFPAANTGKPTLAFENSVYRRYNTVYQNYLNAPKRDGDIVATRVAPRLIFCPMLCIQGEFSETNQHPLSYMHLENCLTAVRELSLNLEIPVYIPQFYASPKKDKWEKINQIIRKTSTKFTIWESDKTIVLRLCLINL